MEHDDVMSSLLDLQRRLRNGDGEAGEASGVGTAPTVVEARPAAPRQEETVEVVERDLSVLMTPVVEPLEDDDRAGRRADERTEPEPPERFAPVTQLPTASGGEDRVAALNQRLSRLEGELSDVMGSIDTMHGTVAAEVTADVAARLIAIQQATDERTVRLVADRIDAVSTRVTGELEEQRRGLAGLLEQRMRDMTASLRTAIREVAGEPEDGSEPPPPAP
jgi:hypothetical protein